MLQMKIIALVSALAVTSQSTLVDPVVDLGYARYRGLYNETLGINDFFGLPYAAPPVGNLRWRAPQPYSPNNFSGATIDATRLKPPCVQGVPYWIANRDTPGIEDCLTLNIVQPTNIPEGETLPVLFNIHGGGYAVGNSSMFQSAPYAMLRHSKNSFVFVSTQYRLGAYGFLGSKRFFGEGGDANIGLLDQRFALDWVQKHISAFGGDPTRVTIMGGSAGGGSVTSQVIMYGGVQEPPFRAAIAEFPWWQQNLKEEQLQKQYEYLLSGSNCTDLNCLRSLPEAVLGNVTHDSYERAYSDGAYGHGHFFYGPYVDGNIIMDLPSREFKAGHFSKVPMLVDREQYEGVSFSNWSMTTVEELVHDIQTQFPYSDAHFIERLLALYPLNDYNSTFWQRVAWFGDFSINCPSYYVAKSFSEYFFLPTWKLTFNAGSQVHGAISPFLTILDYELQNGANATLAGMMKDWYTSFAIYNDPNRESWSGIEKPFWPLYADGSAVMSINYTESGAVDDVYYDKTSKCEFFWENGDIVQN